MEWVTAIMTIVRATVGFGLLVASIAPLSRCISSLNRLLTEIEPILGGARLSDSVSDPADEIKLLLVGLFGLLCLLGGLNQLAHIEMMYLQDGISDEVKALRSSPARSE
jgi:hypothetical protein